MYDCIIIGGGPAGLTAGMYTARGGLKSLLLESGLPGGQITSSSEVENYPGQHTIVTGMELVANWASQATHFGLEIQNHYVHRIQKIDSYFSIETDSSLYSSKSVIIATGSIPKKAGFKGEDLYFGRGISVCATCDGFFYRNKNVIVLGGGDSALEEALYLAKIARQVTIIHRRSTFRAAPITVEKVYQTSNINVLMESSILEAYGDNSGLLGVKIREQGEEKELPIDGVFIFVGRDVLTTPLQQSEGNYLTTLNDKGEVCVDLRMKTSCEGLFAAGDIRQDASRQVVCAAGDGATAAISVITYLEQSHLKD